MIDRDAAVPLYHQIFLELRDEIVGGHRATGSLAPTEQELAAAYSVSRITARRALDELALQRFVERKRRVGTTVIYQPPSRPIEANIDQAVDSLLALGQATKVRLLHLGEEPASFTVADALRLAPGDPVVRAVRVRSLDGAPLGYVVSYVPARLASVLTRAGLGATPILGLLEAAGHKPGAAEQTISAISADATLSDALEIEPRAPLLRIARTVFDLTGAPMLLTWAHYRSDRYQIRIDLQQPRGA